MTEQGITDASRGATPDALPPDPALVQLTHLATTGVALPDALRAAAAELGRGPAQRWLTRSAERLERGELLPAAGDASTCMAAIAAGPGGAAGSLGDYLATRRMLAEMRRRIRATLWCGALLIAVAATLGLVMQILLSGAVLEMIEDFDLQLPAGLLLLTRAVWILLVGLLLLAAAVVALLLFKQSSLVEWIWDHVPLVGRAMAAIELAEMSDGLARVLASRHPYPAAFAWTAACTTSPRLRRWLQQASAALQQGASVDAVLARLPYSAGVLPALVGPLGPAPDRPDQAWGIAARTAYRTAERRTERTTMILPPVTAVCAAATAWASLSVLVAGFSTFISLLGGF